MITSTLAARTRPRCRLTRTGPRCGAPNDAPTPTCYRTRIGQLAVTAPDELYDSRLPGLYAIAGRDCDRVGVGDDAPRLRGGLMFTQPPPPATIPAAPARAEAEGARAQGRGQSPTRTPIPAPANLPPTATGGSAPSPGRFGRVANLPPSATGRGADAPASRAGRHSRRGRPGPDQRTTHRPHRPPDDTVHQTTPFTGRHRAWRQDDRAGRPGHGRSGVTGPDGHRWRAARP